MKQRLPSINPPCNSVVPGLHGDGFRSRSAGFTLVELLVALVILALISMAAYRGLNSVLETQDRLAQETRKWQRLTLFFGNVEQDVAQVIRRPVINRVGSEEPEWWGRDTDGKEAPQLLLTRAGIPDQNGVLHEPKRIGYLYEGGAVYILRWPTLDQSANAEPVKYRMLEGVTAFRLRYLSPAGQWQSSWPGAGQAGTLPLALEVGLTLNGGIVISRIFALT